MAANAKIFLRRVGCRSHAHCGEREAEGGGPRCRQISSSQSVDPTAKMLKEGNMDAIKLEGVAPSRITTAKAIVEFVFAVMVGLTAKASSVLGGFRPHGKIVGLTRCPSLLQWPESE